jgi:hypothetical protein
MKYIKRFEKSKYGFDVGYYVIIRLIDDLNNSNNISKIGITNNKKDEIENSIGQIEEMYKYSGTCKVIFDYIEMTCNLSDIVFYSKNKEDLIPYITANKYNL